MNTPLFSRYSIWLCLLCMLATRHAFAQQDTALMLKPEQLHEKDVLSFSKVKTKEKVVSATRIEERLEDLPYSTWVITSEDILRYGFVTLADVLKAAPGIRVSQPGNAREGETFMMMGLSGNQYVKILINDIPVKPSIALGMPIGAQLPIRQADRIEVLYGTSGGMMYGNEACAGVVNIIIKETERPIFTQANLGLGTQRYNNLDLMFGGRLFRDENVLRFSVYGSSTVRGRTNIYWDKAAYYAPNYYLKGINNLDFSAMDRYGQSVDTLDYFNEAELAHESRMFGMLVAWKGLKFTYHRMSRSDASCLGYSPLAISYNSPGNVYKDRIDNYSLSFWKKRQRYRTVTNISFESYQVENTSSAGYIFNAINAQSYLTQGGANLSDNDKNVVLNKDYNAYSGGPRFLFARAIDFRAESRFRYRLWKKLWFDAGINAHIGLGIPEIGHYREPQTFTDLNTTNPLFEYPFFRPDALESGILQPMINLDWMGKKWRVQSGLAYAVTAGEWLPRIAVLYHLDSLMNIYANGSIAYKQYQAYQYTNIYGFTEAPGYMRIIPSVIGYDKNDYGVDVEMFHGGEVGFRRKKSQISVFSQKSYGLWRDGYYRAGKTYSTVGGYYANPGLSHAIWGMQLRLVGESVTEVKKKNKLERDITWRGELFVQYTRGKEWFGLNYGSTNEIRNFPKYITQFRSSGRSGRYQVTISINRQSSVLSKIMPFASSWDRLTYRSRHDGFSTMDLLNRFYVTKNFVLYCNILNVFNRKAYGIDASGSVDDLLAPLQTRRQVQFGITYNMN